MIPFNSLKYFLSFFLYFFETLLFVSKQIMKKKKDKKKKTNQPNKQTLLHDVDISFLSKFT